MMCLLSTPIISFFKKVGFDRKMYENCDNGNTAIIGISVVNEKRIFHTYFYRIRSTYISTVVANFKAVKL